MACIQNVGGGGGGDLICVSSEEITRVDSKRENMDTIFFLTKKLKGCHVLFFFLFVYLFLFCFFTIYLVSKNILKNIIIIKKPFFIYNIYESTASIALLMCKSTFQTFKEFHLLCAWKLISLKKSSE